MAKFFLGLAALLALMELTASNVLASGVVQSIVALSS
jgi:hypothetical protein